MKQLADLGEGKAGSRIGTMSYELRFVGTRGRCTEYCFRAGLYIYSWLVLLHLFACYRSDLLLLICCLLSAV